MKHRRTFVWTPLFMEKEIGIHARYQTHFSAIAAGCLVLGLTACGGGLTADDAATFVLGDLDAAYKGEIRQEYLDLLTDTTEEDARQTYQDNIAIEAEYLLGYLETAYSSGGYYDDGLQASMDQSMPTWWRRPRISLPRSIPGPSTLWDRPTSWTAGTSL